MYSRATLQCGFTFHHGENVLKGKYKMKKKNWIYSLIIILIIVLAIVGLITFVHTKYGNQAENHTKNETKDYKNIHIAIINEDQPTKYNGKN